LEAADLTAFLLEFLGSLSGLLRDGLLVGRRSWRGVVLMLPGIPG